MRFHRHFLLAAGVSLAPAQGPSATEYSAKVVLLERISRFVEWPAPPQPSERGGPFILAVVGRSPFGDELEAYFLTHKVKGRAVSVKYFRGPKDLGPCDLLFISSSEEARLPDILQQVAKRPTLTVGDSDGYAARGVMVNIIRDQAHLGFEVNLSAAKAAGIQLASSFLQVAKKR
ncbi:MAG: YfiR family protein [Geothrix sp.]|nr:YfiR family protein [Geothrix sp.]